MAKELTASVVITSREETVADELASAPGISRVLIHRTFSGEIEGTSVANLLLCQIEGGGGFTSIERFTGSIDGRRGTVIFHHGRHAEGDGSSVPFGAIIPNSGTDELTGLTGSVGFSFSPGGASLTLTLPE